MNPRNPNFFLERLLLTLWVGGQWAIGYLAAPVLFHVLDDRRLAGSLAGEMFTAMAYVGLVCGALLVVGLFNHQGAAAWRSWRFYALGMMLALIVLGEFGLHPLIAQLREGGLPEGSAEAARFGRLHGISSILFLLNSLLGLVLVLFGLRAEPAGSDRVDSAAA